MTASVTYDQFLKSKEKRIIESGFEVSANWPHLYPFQSFIVTRAIKAGRYAIFADCGLGKTRMQLTWAHEVVKYTCKSVLILAPLAVVAQTIQEGNKVGIECIELLPEMYAMNELPANIYILNYEQLDNITPEDYAGLVLDESSILKNFEGAYRAMLIDWFKDTPYKLACTATPSPNDPMELGNHAEFLGAMSYNEMLAMYFVHDGGDTSKWRLKGHSIKPFWKFISSWSIMLSKPSDIGFSDEGYNLPPLNIIERTIKTPKRQNGELFNDVAVSATNFNAELRLTKIERLDEVANIVNNSTDSFIIWVKQNEEGEDLRKMIPDAVEVKGSDSPEWKKDKLLGFANNQFRVLITKVKIGGFGMNFQNCHNMIFASPDFSFEGIYQALRRELRFGQKNEVNAWIVTTDTMHNVIESFKRKKAQFENMQHNMQLSMNDEFNREEKAKYEFKEYKSDTALFMHGDCVNLVKNIPSESVGFSIFSPPFAELYTYSDDIADMGNSKDYNEFLTAFNFLCHELYRILWSGRNVAIHCMDLPIQKGKEGFIGLRDFSGMVRESMEAAGFIYHSRVTIWKDPVVEMQRTKALGLLHKQIKKDSTMCRVGIPDYLLIIRKDGERQHPVKNDSIPVDLWQQYASPVWMDIDYGNTLNGREGRADNDEKHICPLQLDTIKRAIHLYTNEGDTVFTPFGGIGSELYQAIKMNRKAIGIELKETYYEAGIKNIKSAELTLTQKALF